MCNAPFLLAKYRKIYLTDYTMCLNYKDQSVNAVRVITGAYSEMNFVVVVEVASKSIFH